MLDARVKLFLLFMAGVLALALDRPLSLTAAAGISLLIFLTVGLRSGAIRRTGFALGAMLLMLWGAALTQGVFYIQAPRTEWWGWHPTSGIGFWIFGENGLALYREGMLYGATQGLRLVLTAAAGLALVFSTDSGQLLAALSFYRVPRGLAFMAVTSLRFVPLLAQEVSTSWQAARLRGYSPAPWRCGPVATLSVPLSLAQPVLSSCMRRSGALAATLELRGMGESPVVAKLQSASGISWLVALFGSILGLGVLTSKLAFWLYQMDLYYASDWRIWYDFTRRWL